MHKFIDNFSLLGQRMKAADFFPEEVLSKARAENPWFTNEAIGYAKNSIARDWLVQEKLAQWLEPYQNIFPIQKATNIGIVMAGNIPLVGFHDLLCVLASGNRALIKTSSKDRVLTRFLINEIIKIWPDMASSVHYVDKLSAADAIIATGSNNSSLYFEQYFSKFPHIIRKNRNAVAVLSNQMDDEQIKALGDDIFRYFGLGCRNVSKIYIPEDFDFDHFFVVLNDFESIMQHHKYKNNYDYNRTLLLLNQIKHYASNYLILKEDKSIASPVAMLHYEYYKNLEEAEGMLGRERDKIQCIVSNSMLNMEYVAIGQAQKPALWHYADGINTMDFLQSLY